MVRSAKFICSYSQTRTVSSKIYVRIKSNRRKRRFRCSSLCIHVQNVSRQERSRQNILLIRRISSDRVYASGKLINHQQWKLFPVLQTGKRTWFWHSKENVTYLSLSLSLFEGTRLLSILVASNYPNNTSFVSRGHKKYWYDSRMLNSYESIFLEFLYTRTFK